MPVADWFAEDGIAEPEIEARLIDAADRHMAEKAVRLGPDIMRMAEKNLLLQVLDQQWKEHLFTLDQLRQGITLRAYAQKDPLNEYKREAFMMFETMLANMRETTSMVLSHVEVRQNDDDEAQKSTMCQRQINQAPIGKYLETRFAPADLVKSLNIVVVHFSDLQSTSWMLISK